MLPKTMGLNLHSIVRGAITSVNNDLDCELYRMTGRHQTDDEGDTTPIFEGPAQVKAQFQSISQDMIRQMDMLEITTSTRRVYLYATPYLLKDRGRNGDLLGAAVTLSRTRTVRFGPFRQSLRISQTKVGFAYWRLCSRLVFE